MPSKLTNIIYVPGGTPTPHYDDLRNYTTPGQHVLVATTNTAYSVDNCPEMAPGVMKVTEYNHSTAGAILGIMQQFTSQISGVTYTCIHTPNNNYWSKWTGGTDYLDITPIPALASGDNVLRLYKSADGRVTLMIILNLKSPITGWVKLADIPQQYFPLVALDAPCILRSASNGVEAGFVSVNWSKELNIGRQTTSNNATLSMVRATVSWYTS